MSANSPTTSPPGRRSVRYAGYAAIAVIGIAVVTALLALPAVLTATDEIRRGATGISQAAAAVGRNDVAAARDVSAASAASFARAEEALRSGWAAPARVVPGLGRHIRMGEAFARSGAAAARAAAAAANVVAAQPEGGWWMRSGTVDVGALETARGLQERVVDEIGVAHAELVATPATWVAGSLSGRRAEALRRAERADASARRTLEGLEVAGRLLGAEGDRRHLVLASDLATGRGTGGVWRHYLVLHASQGRLALEEGREGDPASFPSPVEAEEVPQWYRDAYGRYGALRSWTETNLAADFPAAADIARTAARGTVGETQGVVQLTPPGVAALLRLSGPVVVDDWPVAVDAEAVTDILVRRSQSEGSPPPGASLYASVVRAALERLFTTDVALDASTLRTLGRAVEGGHLLVHTPDPADASPLTLLGLSGAVDRTDGATDVLGVVTSDRTGTRNDAFIRRRVRYTASPDPSTRIVRGRLELTLRNASGAEARQLVVLLRRPGDAAPRIEVGGEPVQPSRDREGELVAYHTEVAVPPRSDQVLRASFSLPEGVEGTGRTRAYRLHLFTQPLADPPPTEVGIDPPRGWEIGGEAATRRTERGDVVITLELRQPLVSWAGDVVVFRPWRALRGLF